MAEYELGQALFSLHGSSRRLKVSFVPCTSRSVVPLLPECRGASFTSAMSEALCIDQPGDPFSTLRFAFLRLRYLSCQHNLTEQSANAYRQLVIIRYH